MPITPVEYVPQNYVRSGTLGTLIGLRGQHQSEALLRAGEIQARLWSDLGQNIAQGVTSYAKQRQDAPIRAQEAKLRDLQIQGAQGEVAGQQRAASDRTAMDTAMGSGLDPDAIEKSLVQSGNGHLVPTFRKSWNDAETAKQNLVASKAKVANDENDYLGALAAGVKPFLGGPDKGVGALTLALQHAKEIYPDADQVMQQVQQHPESLPQLIDGLIAKSPTQQKLLSEQQDRDLKRQQEQGAAANITADNVRADAAAAEAARHNKAMEARPVAGASSTAADDVKQSVQGMREGTIPPMVPGRASKEYLATLAEAHRQGYDLQAAVTDWNATQKHVATLNGQQQTRLNQSINALPDLLDTVDALASKWKGGKFPILNKANLALAKNGAYGDDVATVARQLDSQIADVTADLGNVYMGGNSPTDQALSLAGKSLGGEWSEKVLHDMVALARKNVTIRQNSIRTTGVQGASANNPYAPAQPAAAPASAAPQAPAGWKYVAKPGGGWTAVQDK